MKQDLLKLDLQMFAGDAPADKPAATPDETQDDNSAEKPEENKTAKLTKADLQKLLEEKDAELAKMRETLKAQAVSITEQANAEKAGAAKAIDKDDPMRYVTVKLFKDNERYKDDVLVNVESGKFRYNVQIKRGVQVQMPFFAAEVLRQTEAQDARTAMLIAEQGAKYEKMRKDLNL